MTKDVPVTKILFVDNDEMGFQFRKCMAQVLKNLPPIELFHALDATEALSLMESLKPHVVVLDEECAEETDLMIESLTGTHPPILVQTLEHQAPRPSSNEQVTRIEKNESLEGIHQTLLMASSLGMSSDTAKEPDSVH